MMITRPRDLSLTSVIALSLANMLLTFFLLHSRSCRNPKINTETFKADEVTEYQLKFNREYQKYNDCIMERYKSVSDQLILNLDVRLGRSDSRRQFKTFDSVLIGNKFSELSQSDTVCLATQSSLEKLYSLVQVAHHWTGSISVALYTAGDEEFEALQKYLTYLRECYSPIFERINFSLAIPRKKIPTKQPQNYAVSNDYDCSRPEATLNSLLNDLSTEHTNWRSRNIYPQNHMRNLARKNCQSDWVFLTDVDVIPSIGLADSLDQFLRETEVCEKCAYVIPTYEMDTRVRFPTNKSELVRLAKKGLARPFHWKVFIHNQYATNFTKWVLDVTPGSVGHINVMSGKIYISHNVTNFEFLYEPFYVSKDIVPIHDERFMGYGYTRNTQVYEMFIAGYQFKVLSPAFTIHWGLQTRKTRSAWRERQNIVNRKQFEQFKREIYARYLTDDTGVSKPYKK